ncbi:MAG: hypothetical protein ABIG87_03065 [Patescibacteria group bacterium]
MSLSSRRKLKYQMIFIIVAVAVIIVSLFLFFYTPPTCYDKIRNQDEEGIDCGGPCELVCGFKIIAPIIQWSRISKTSKGVYNVVAMVENPNISAETKSVSYVFKLYDIEGILVSAQKGNAFIPANATLPIFEGNIITGNRIPVRVNFEFTDNPEWTNGKSSNLISIKNIKFVEKNNSPRVSALVENNAVKDIKNVELVVLLFDMDNNLINSSKTVLDFIKKNSSEYAIFTWPELFEKKISKIDIVPVSKID